MKVLCIEDSGFGYYYAGKVYEVLAIDYDGYYKIEISANRTWICCPRRFIRINKLNDNIRVI